MALANSSSDTVVTVGTAGNVWTFDDASPTINLNGLTNASGSNLTINVSPGLSLNQDLNIAGSGTATFNIDGAISGSHNLVKSGTSAVILTGANTYTGDTAVNGGSLAVSGGSINSPNGTFNVINGIGTLSSTGSITVNTLLLTNNDLVSVTNSFFNFYSGTLTTSNTTWIIPANAGPTLGGTFIMNAGTHQFVPLVQNGFTVTGNLNVKPGATLGLGSNKLFSGFVGSGNSIGGAMLVDNSSVTGAVFDLKVGGNTGSSGASLLVTNGGLVQLTPTAANQPVLEVGSGVGASNNWLTVTGTNSAGQQAAINLSNGRLNVGNGASTSGSYNASLVVGAGGLINNLNLLLWSTNSSVLVTDGGKIAGITGGSSAFVIGRCGGAAVGCVSNVVTVTGTDAAGNPSMIDGGGQQCTVGYGATGSSVANAYNGLVVANGGVVTNVTILRLGLNAANNCDNNYVLVSGGGKLYLTNQLVIGTALLQNTNSVTVTGPGSLIDLNGTVGVSQVFIGNVTTCTNNSLTVANGGKVANMKYIRISGVNGKLILDGGILSFSTNTFGSVIITNSASPVNPQFLVRNGGAVEEILHTANDGWLISTNELPLLEDPSSPGGGFTKIGPGMLRLADGNTYTGNTVISNGTIQLCTPTTLNTNTTVYLVNTNTAAIDLNFTGTNIVKDLYINGVRQPQGVYASNPPGITRTCYLQVSVGAVVAPPILSYTLSGSPGAQSLNFNWTGSFKLQFQTNALSVGLNTNWYDYPGGGSSPVSVPVTSGNASVFFRLAQYFGRN